MFYLYMCPLFGLSLVMKYGLIKVGVGTHGELWLLPLWHLPERAVF